MTSQTRWSRRNLLRGGLAAGGVLVAPGLLAACSSVGGDPLEKIKNGETVTLGLANEPPYAFEKGGKATGESVEMYKYILKKLGAKEEQIETKVVEFGSLIKGLTAGDYDLVAAGMFITPDRCEQAIFTEPDYITATTLLVRAGNKEKIKDYSSFAGNKKLKLGVFQGAVEKTQAVEAKVPEEQIEERKGLNDLKTELSNNAIDAIALTVPTLRYAAEQSKGEYETVEPFVPEINGKPSMGAGAAVVRKEDTKFRDAINKELKKITSNEDTWLSITEEFTFTKDMIPTEEYTTEKLCKG